MPEAGEKRDLVLNPGEYAYLQDLTRGVIKTHVGPTIVNQTAQEQPVVYDPEKKRFRRCSRLEEAVCLSPVATEGDYIVLVNPSSETNKFHPKELDVATQPGLSFGSKINIPGPATFALWPAQMAKVVQGHTLRSNEFLVVRIYNDVEARKNWSRGVVKKAVVDGGQTVDATEAASVATASAEALDLTIGKQFVIKGTEVSYYIPPTGVEVVPGPDGNYTRPAVTLEVLEHATLVDENGNKRFERGPKVVFPSPTEEFEVNAEGNRKDKAIELNLIQGIQVKVIIPYTDEVTGHEFKVGDEIFLTGKECAIYYPRPEHSLVVYGGRKKHYAVAVPAGEGRYVMDRESGQFVTVKGPTMLLPNPVKEVIVRRVLSDRECKLWYSGSADALTYNRSLRAMTADVQANYVADTLYQNSLNSVPESSQATSRGGEMPRRDKFTKPREITLDTKYDGVPVVCPWTGYAVMVVSKGSDKREVKIGPTTILLDYDQSLEVLSLSTGKPKNTDKLEETVYLRIKNNKVSDIIEDVKTGDGVRLDVKLSFRVNFVTEYNGQAINPERWFEVENYVKLLCDHVRSMVKGHVRKIKNIEDFYADSVDIIRNLLLGEKKDGTPRPGMFFPENGMKIDDVEVLDVTIKDQKVREMLENAQFQAVAGMIKVGQAEKDLALVLRQEEISQTLGRAKDATKLVSHELTQNEIKRALELAMARAGSLLKDHENSMAVAKAEECASDLRASAALERVKSNQAVLEAKAKAENDERIRIIKAETESVVSRFGAGQQGFSEALLALSNQDTLAKIAEALSVQNLIGGRNAVDVVQQLFAGSPLSDMLAGVVGKAVGAKATDAGPRSTLR